MLVLISTETPRSIGPFASRANGRFGVKGLHHAVRLPLDHSHRHGLVNVSPVFVETRIVNGNADVGCRPRRRSVGIAHPAHVSRLEVLLALFADGKPRVGKLNADLLVETGRSKRQNVL